MKNKEHPVLQDLYRDVRRSNKTKMKKTLTIVFAVFLIVGLLGVSSAENTTENMNLSEISLPEPGRANAIENSWDKLRLAFTFGNEKKIQKALDIAEERLAEAEEYADKDPEKAEKARQRYEYFAEKAEENMNRIEEAQNRENANESFGELVRVQNRFEIHKQRAIMAHSMALEKMAEGNMSEEQIDKIRGIFEEFENRSSEMEQKMEQKRENLETRFRVRNEMTSENFENFMNNVEKEQGFENAREQMAKRADFIEQKNQNMPEDLDEKRNSMNPLSENRRNRAN